ACWDKGYAPTNRPRMHGDLAGGRVVSSSNGKFVPLQSTYTTKVNIRKQSSRRVSDLCTQTPKKSQETCRCGCKQTEEGREKDMQAGRHNGSVALVPGGCGRWDEMGSVLMLYCWPKVPSRPANHQCRAR